MDEDERRSLLGLFPTPDVNTLDQADTQQILWLFRSPIVGFSIPVVGSFIKRAFAVANLPKSFEVGNTPMSFSVGNKRRGVIRLN